MRTTDAPAPFLVVGQMTAPFSFERRELVRATMLTCDSVVTGSVAFRFVVGGTLRCSEKPSQPQACDEESTARLRREVRRRGDVLELDALDGRGVDIQCACAEKTLAWLSYAAATWPRAAFVAKTEDDAYVNLPTLEIELRRLHAARRPHVAYGAFDLCAMPRAPREGPPPGKAVSQPARGPSRPLGYGGCWLGRLEDMSTGFRNASEMMTWARGKGADGCGIETSASSSASAAWLGGSPPVPSPFPTGALFASAADLTESLLHRCSYYASFVAAGRAENRRGDCRKTDASLGIGSWATLSCDSLIGHLLAQCAAERRHNLTVAHMTLTKAHSYSWRSGVRDFSNPSSISIVVHALKRMGAGRRINGPNNTLDGEWWATHAVLSRSRDPGFPPLLWNYDPRLTEATGRLADPIQPAHHSWYAATCGTYGRAERDRLEQMTRGVRGPRDGRDDRAYLGGLPDFWSSQGCHPGRGHLYPAWRRGRQPPGGTGSAAEAAAWAAEAAEGGGGRGSPPADFTTASKDGAIAWDWAPSDRVASRAATPRRPAST